MKLNELPAVPGTKSKNRVGRGMATGNGKTCGRGQKGQKSRSGGFHKVGFEGGQMPLQRRLPKRGFTNHFKKSYVLLKVGQLEVFEAGDEINLEKLMDQGLVKKKCKDGVKLLSDGELDKPLTVHVDNASKAAISKIEAAGGKVVLAKG